MSPKTVLNLWITANLKPPSDSGYISTASVRATCASSEHQCAIRRVGASRAPAGHAAIVHTPACRPCGSPVESTGACEEWSHRRQLLCRRMRRQRVQLIREFPLQLLVSFSLTACWEKFTVSLSPGTTSSTMLRRTRTCTYLGHSPPVLCEEPQLGTSAPR